MFLIGVLGCAGAFAQGQEAAPPQAPAKSPTVLRSEKRVVLVDTVVTDKKGNYIRDLTGKDFRVWEDNKEQKIESFSFEADPASPNNGQKHYLVLFFDNSTMQMGEQAQARQAALKFLDANAGANRLMAVVDFGGTLRIAQNFTGDAARLKQVVSGVKFSAVSPNGDVASLGAPQLTSAAADFGARDVLLALRSLAKSLASVPGRKTLVFLSSGFVLNPELRSELTAAIDVCNKANVAIYPIDVRGLVAPAVGGPIGGPPGTEESMRDALPGFPGVRLVTAAFVQQRPGGGGGTAGANPGGASGGSRPGGGNPGSTRGGAAPTSSTPTRAPANNAAVRNNPVVNPNQPYRTNNPFSQPRLIVPTFPPSASANQDVLYALATGTGGFVIVNTNDLLGGLQKIANEQNEYYVLSYSPSEESKEGSCHMLRVKVDRGGTNVRARSGYCDAKPVDFLAGTPVEKDLETRATASIPGNVRASMKLPFFYTSPNTARVNVAMEIAPDALKFEKEKGKLHSEVNVLGMAYAQDGTVAAKFSDTATFDFEDKKELKKFQEQPVHYENQFDIASGQYNLKVVFSSGGESFGKLQMPLVVDAYDSKKFGISAVALSQKFHRVADLDVGLDAALLEDKTPLVSAGMQLTPSGSTVFQKTEPAAAYIEVYEPLLLEPTTPKVGLQMRILDRKTGEQKLDTGFFTMAAYIKPGNPVIPIGVKVPLDKLAPGSYRAEFQAIDSAGNSSVIRTADFDVQ
jgi:VWFA-related protein